MKFKGSREADRFSSFWNRTAVYIYTQITEIISKPAFFFSESKKELAPRLAILTTRYHDAVKSLLCAVHREPLDKYEDPENLILYKRETIKQTIADLEYYYKEQIITAATFEEYKANINLFGEETTPSVIPHLRR